jgi:glycine cleavage system H lipoate-binding protein
MSTRCPFLREAHVRQCTASSVRTMITHEASSRNEERCTTPDFVSCPAVQGRPDTAKAGSLCPYFHESLMQYCSAAPLLRYVPYTESSLSSCGTSSHSYCELFLGTVGDVSQDDAGANAPIAVPSHLWYAPNHLWLDIATDGTMHVGADAFLAAVIGNVDALHFESTPGRCYPTAVISARGVDLHLVFPRHIMVTRVNAYLRTAPSKITTHPYTLGWLFEGTAPAGGTDSLVKGLRTGQEAAAWMSEESSRLTDVVHRWHCDREERLTMADGGEFARPLIAELGYHQILSVYAEFFSPAPLRRPNQ